MQFWITLTEVGNVIRTADPVEVVGPIDINTEKLVYLRRRHDKLTVVGLDGGEFIMVAESPELIHQKRAEAVDGRGSQLA